MANLNNTLMTLGMFAVNPLLATSMLIKPHKIKPKMYQKYNEEVNRIVLTHRIKGVNNI